MRQIRNNVFETNSSSVHSICISKDTVNITPGETLHFGIYDYGWDFDCEDPASYLYTAIWGIYYGTSGNREFYERIDKLKHVLDKNNIKYSFEDPANGDGYIDHGSALVDFIDEVVNDEDKLLRLLLNPKSTVHTGNDNSSWYDNKCWEACEYTWDDELGWIPNPMHDKENYDYYFKGN